MIEKMKTVQIVAAASRKKQMLDELRSLGLLHIAEKKSADAASLERFSSLQKTALELKDFRGKQEEGPLLSDEEFEVMYRSVRDTMEEKKSLMAARNTAVLEADRLRPWGDFSPAEVRDLRKQGIDLHFYRMGKKEFRQLSEDNSRPFVKLASVDKMATVATLGPLDPFFPATEFSLPEKGITERMQEAEECDAAIAACDEVLTDAARYDASFQKQILKAQNAAEYSAVSETAAVEDGLVWLSGYIPEVNVPAFKEAAARAGWAWVLDDPATDDDQVPTKIRYTKFTRLIIPVFDILGTVPAYREYDISAWFLGFFILFFAMIIGDAGYGFLFLIAAIVLTIKTRDKTRTKKMSTAVLLTYVLAIATIVWGSLTGTWFGFEQAMNIPLLRSLVLPSIANYPQYFGLTATDQQNVIMKFCFSIGVIQLALACIMNIRRKIGEKNLNWVADLGWLFSICALYFVILTMVIGEQFNLTIAGGVVLVGFILAVLFGGMAPGLSFGKGLKAGVANAFTVFLDTISAFGNIMSYIRLFAVGLASLAIAQSFNSMGSGFHGAGIVAGIGIMIIGHALNIVMGLLSVVVHGVRLNLLEFSGQLGMEWSGTAYDPFQERDTLKK